MQCASADKLLEKAAIGQLTSICVVCVLANRNVIARADALVGPGAGTQLPPATGGGPGESAGSYGAPNSQPNLGESQLCHPLATLCLS